MKLLSLQQQAAQDEARNHGRFGEQNHGDPGQDVLSGVPASITARIMAEALAGVRGGDTTTFAGIIQDLIDSGEYGDHIAVGQEPGEVMVQVVTNWDRDVTSRYELKSQNIPDGGTGAEALRAYTDEARNLLTRVTAVRDVMFADIEAPSSSVDPSTLAYSNLDDDGRPRTCTWSGSSFTRCDDIEDAPSDTYGFIIRAEHPIDDDEMGHLAQLTGYAWAAQVHGEGLGQSVRLDDRTMYLPADSTKGGGTVSDFVDAMPAVVYEGSGIRKTDRSGPGTKGTSLVEGMPGLNGFALFFE